MLLERKKHKITVNHRHISHLWSLSQTGGIICSFLTTSKTWAMVVFCPLLLGKSKKMMATKNVESSHKSGKIHILLALWIYFIFYLWLGTIYLWSKRQKWEVVFQGRLLGSLCFDKQDSLKSLQWITCSAGVWCDHITLESSYRWKWYRYGFEVFSLYYLQDNS